MKAFIYIWRDRLRNMYYIGSHVGEPSDGYLSSSRWLNAEIKFRPADFRRRIIKEVPADEVKKEEYRLIKFIHYAEFGKKYYNLKSGREKGCIAFNKGKSRDGRSDQKPKREPQWHSSLRVNPMSKQESRERLSQKAKGRKKLTHTDGTWTWCYPNITQPPEGG